MSASKKRRKPESSTIEDHVDHDDRKSERRRRRLRSGYIEVTPPRSTMNGIQHPKLVFLPLAMSSIG
jgi:hypothetical protein